MVGGFWQWDLCLQTLTELCARDEIDPNQRVCMSPLPPSLGFRVSCPTRQNPALLLNPSRSKTQTSLGVLW